MVLRLRLLKRLMSMTRFCIAGACLSPTRTSCRSVLMDWEVDLDSLSPFDDDYATMKEVG